MSVTIVRSLVVGTLLTLAVASATCNSADDPECLEEHSMSLLQVDIKVHQELNKGQATAVAEAAPKPFFTKETMPHVSTTMKCIINLATQFFAVYTALAIVRTLREFGYNLTGLAKILETTASTVTYAPMLCALFLGSRMRAIQLTHGETEKNQLPQAFVQNAMFACTYATMLQAVLVLLVGLASGMGEVKTDSEGNLDTSKMPGVPPVIVQILTLLRYVVMAMLYGGFAVVAYGIFTMEAPAGQTTPPVSPAVKCTILLGSLFFLIYTFTAVVKTIFELAPALRQTPGLDKLRVSAESAKMTVNFAPMISILFIGARMRALQIDPVNGSPQPWAQNCFYGCTLSIIVQAALVILLPFVAGGECKQGECEGDVSFKVENKLIGGVLTAVRYTCLFGLYGGVSAVVYSVISIQSPKGAAFTPNVSPTMQCVTALTAQFFLVYTMLFLCVTVKSFVQHDTVKDMMTKGIAIFDAGRQTVNFAPMLACLFIGTRMRALQLAKDASGNIPPTAGPQKWVQDCMYLATGAVFVQLMMVMLVSLLLADSVEVDEDGMVKTPASTSKYVAYFLVMVRYANLLSMYFGASGIVIGVFLMTPLDLQPFSSLSLFPALQ